jgi:hydrogenase maturation protein HypF
MDVFLQKDLLPLQGWARTELDIVKQMLTKSVNSPVTTSAGRLFDAVASLIGSRQVVSFEGQAAMELEFLTAGIDTEERYSFSIEEGKHAAEREKQNRPMTVDWSSIISGILDDVRHHTQIGIISAKFHNTLSEIIVEVAQKAGQDRVVISGGCFQNRNLTERAIKRLREEGFRPYWHQRVPPNDGGIALGQAYAALCKNKNKQLDC